MDSGARRRELRGGGVGLRLGWNRLLCALRTIGGRGWAQMGRKFRNGQTLSKSRPSSRLSIALCLLCGVPATFLAVGLGSDWSRRTVAVLHLQILADRSEEHTSE